jgi:hypothetical protein
MRLATRVHLDLRKSVEAWPEIQRMVQSVSCEKGAWPGYQDCTHASAQRPHETSNRDARRVQVRGDMENSNMVKKLR